MRKLCWFAAPAAVAMFAAVYLFPESGFFPLGMVCVLTGVLSFPLTRRFSANARRAFALTFAGLAAGFFYTAAFWAFCRAPAEALITGESQSLTFTVLSYPSETATGARVEAVFPMEHAPDPHVVLYAERDALDLLPGDQITAEASLRSSGTYRGESSDYYPARGIYLIGYTDDITLEKRPETVSPSFWPILLGKTLKDAIGSLFPEDVSGFLIALITGDKRFLPTGLYAAFRRAGLAHVVAVSGLHVGFLAGQLTTLLGKRRRFSAVVGLTVVFFFAAMVGNGPSVIRASFMQAFFLMAPLLGREEDKPTTLAAVLLLVLLPCPDAAASISLQLSFASVAGIYLISEPLHRQWMQKLYGDVLQKQSKFQALTRHIVSFFLSTFSTTLGALLFTTPLSALSFQSLSLAGPLTNLLTLWAVSVVFQFGLIATLIGLYAPGLGQSLAAIVAQPARWICLVSRAVAKLPFSAVSLSTIYLAGWAILTYIILLLWLCFRNSVRPAFPIAASVITLCAALFMGAWSFLSGRLTVSVLDVGQGASALFSFHGQTVLVDCGGNSADDPGDIAADAIQALGSSRLDALVLTHCHADHAGGVAELLARVDVGRLFLPDVEPEDPLRQEILALAAESGCPVELVSDDITLTFGETRMELYAPVSAGGTNEQCLSALCTAGDFQVLVTGDMNATAEQSLLRQKNLPDLDLLIVGHHGSKHSTCEELLQATTPEWAVISSGWNTYGHPAPETLERLAAAGCDIYLTRDHGNVTFRLKDAPF